MTDNEKKLLYHLESMRDGCSREVLYEYLPKETVDEIVDRFKEKEYLFETSDLLFINYEKITIIPWMDASINE
jgi:hypothetical protein